MRQGGRQKKTVSWFFKPSQPQEIISGLKESFIKRDTYIVERTNKAEIRPEEESEKVESCRLKPTLNKRLIIQWPPVTHY